MYCLFLQHMFLTNNNKVPAVLIAVILILSGLNTSTNAQQFGSNLKENGQIVTDNSSKKGFTPDVRVSLGSSFSSFGPGFNSFGTFIAPEISFPVNKKFSFQAGIGYSSIFYQAPEQNLFGGTPASYGSVYLSGTYQVNDKLSIRGTGYKTMLLNPVPGKDNQNPAAMDFSNQGVILDLNYKVSDHFHINASFEYREQNYPGFYYYDRGMSNPFGSPFRNPAFGTGF